MFFMQRYFSRLSANRSLFLLALIPAVLYLVFTATRSDRFAIYQDVEIPQDAPLAVSSSPTDFATVDWFVNNQDELLLDSYTLHMMGQRIQREIGPDKQPTPRQLRSDLSLGYAGNRLRVNYSGSDQTMGRFLVSFYANRIVKKGEDGIRRQEMLLAQQGQEAEQETPPIERPYIGLSGGPVEDSSMAVWRSERLPMTLALLAIGIVAVLLLIGLLEAFDVSFKSERQIARSLQMPVLGNVPDINKLAKAMSGRG